jgi:hypothetical protein
MGRSLTKESVCEVRTQDPENFDEEVLALVSAWCHAYHVCPVAQVTAAQATRGHPGTPSFSPLVRRSPSLPLLTR